MSNIGKAAVIGAGSMGSAIAAHLASAGIPTLLLDIPSRESPNFLAQKGLERTLKARPPAFLRPERASLITVGNTDDDFGRLAEVDWVIEAIVEKLEAKQDLLKRLEQVVGPNTIVSSNSSGIPMKLQASVLGDDFKSRFLGSHFFNPPRYLHLLELIPTRHTAPEVLQRLSRFGHYQLGKGIVIAKDVPGFAANRVGVFCSLQTIRTMVKLGLSPDVVDLLTGPILGRPKSATFRTADVVGLDIVQAVAQGLAAATGEDFAVPEVLSALVAKGWLGDKTGQGFYRKVREGDRSKILTLDLNTLDYQERPKVKLSELGPVLALTCPKARTRALLELEGVVGQFTRETIVPQLAYALSKIGQVVDSPEELDNALRWGFGWSVGPVELARYLGQDFLERLGWEGSLPVPSPAPKQFSLNYLRQQATPPVLTCPDSSLWDMGQGVALLEFHSKANSIGQTVLDFMDQAHLKVKQEFQALVIGNEGENFCAGADLNMLWKLAEQGDYATIRQAVETFQGMTSRLRYSPYPVVSALHGLNLGGGCEVGLWSDLCVASAELYTGLVEVGVGILPAGGGTTDTLLRMMDRLLPGADPFLAVRAAFELIAMAKVSGSAFEARQLGILRPEDPIVMNPDLRLSQAKEMALLLAPGYQPPPPRRVLVLGESALANLKAAALALQESGQITAYEVVLASHVAQVLCGGSLNQAQEVSESLLLELEKEAFLSLCGQEKTRARLAHMLKTGKSLRN